MEKIKKSKRPADLNKLASSIVKLTTEQEYIEEHRALESKRGKKGGQSGGKARAKALSPSKRSEIARLAANARWKKGN